ncbi:MAG: hypothetical protein GWO02_07865 [Gammaproteobacteria bacterium]|nr:hypothetical protein [Gammaproteobacteria bacterium]
MKHTFLLEPGEWLGDGTVWDADDTPLPAQARAAVTHAPGRWFNRAVLRTEAEAPAELTTAYEIEPLRRDALATSWRAYNPALGTLLGRLVVYDAAMLSLFRSEDGRLTGSEALVYRNARRYLITGALFDGEVKRSAWQLELKRRARRRRPPLD